MHKEIFGFDVEKSWEYENGFYLTSQKNRLATAIAHWELYKKVIDIPGEIVEVGTYKGTSLIRFLTYRDISESPCSKKVISFDAFGRFPRTGRQEDDEFIQEFEAGGGDGISLGDLERILKLKHFENYELIEGDIFETIPRYLEKHKNLKISILHVDVDAYSPTKFCMESLYEKVTRGGVIVLDDYTLVEGATKAIDEFFRQHSNIRIEKLGLNYKPSYIVKK